jgi:YHS domain-containing protein
LLAAGQDLWLPEIRGCLLRGDSACRLVLIDKKVELQVGTSFSSREREVLVDGGLLTWEAKARSSSGRTVTDRCRYHQFPHFHDMRPPRLPSKTIGSRTIRDIGHQPVHAHVGHSGPTVTSGRPTMDKVDKLSGSLDEGRVTFDRRPETPAQDPVCGKQLQPEGAVVSSEHQGVRVYFCSEDCKRKFEAHPDAYSPPLPVLHDPP